MGYSVHYPFLGFLKTKQNKTKNVEEEEGIVRNTNELKGVSSAIMAATHWAQLHKPLAPQQRAS